MQLNRWTALDPVYLYADAMFGIDLLRGIPKDLDTANVSAQEVLQ